MRDHLAGIDRGPATNQIGRFVAWQNHPQPSERGRDEGHARLIFLDRRQAQLGQHDLRHPRPKPAMPDREQLHLADAVEGRLEIVGVAEGGDPAAGHPVVSSKRRRVGSASCMRVEAGRGFDPAGSAAVLPLAYAIFRGPLPRDQSPATGRGRSAPRIFAKSA
jgi:hypothetical protein